jgi:hypothetical protein
MWSADHRRSTAFRQVVRGGLQAVPEEKALQKFYQTLNEWKMHQYMSVQNCLCWMTFNRKYAN